jgi:NDP-sugar pyrophosphorylase family protein
MKALILAAGLGTRLRPLTENTPKPLLPIAGKPLLQYHLDSLSRCGIKEVLIKAWYLHEQIEQFVADVQSQYPHMRINVYAEKELHGSARFLVDCKKFLEGEDSFIVTYGDNLTTINYEKLIACHKASSPLVTIACYKEKYPETKGMIVFDQDKRIQMFVEKPKVPVPTEYANGGVYVLGQDIFKYEDMLVSKDDFDFGHDLFPFLLAQNEALQVYLMDEFLLDIGTLESYNKAQEIIKNL